MATLDGDAELTLGIDLRSDPITGSLTPARGASRRFSCWIGLTAALEAIRGELAQTYFPPRDPLTSPPAVE